MKKIIYAISFLIMSYSSVYAESISYESVYNMVKSVISISANKYQYENQVKPRLLRNGNGNQFFVSLEKVMSYYDEYETYIRLTQKYEIVDNITILSACFNCSYIESTNESFIISDEFAYIYAVTQSVYHDLNGIDFTSN